ncbi:MAG: metallophosphoesterase [Verrucomicrobiota bacterium]
MRFRSLILCCLGFILPASVVCRAQEPVVELTRGPYLQTATPGGVKIVWRIRTGGKPQVRYGAKPGNLDQTLPASAIILRRTAEDGGSSALMPPLNAAPVGTRQYEAAVTGLKPDTQYFYAVYEGEKRLTAEHPDFSFHTLPEPGKPHDGLFWVVGDSGTGNRVQLKVHTAMRNVLKAENRTLDGYLHVGDMAYGSGMDSEFQGYFFDSYAATLRNTVCWPSMGNHEGRHSNGAEGTGPYYDAYVCPVNGEAGGLPSGTEAYYSFDYGQVHFICLDSHDLPRDPSGAMAQWLKADLDKTKAKWIVAFFHHPPYTKGSHDSDKEQQLIEMRRDILPILESGGVDLVLTGHSHIYERSMLIDGAYATPTVAENVVLDDGDGNPAGDGAYHKSEGLHPNEGAVQIVAGHGGTTLARKAAPSPVMRTTIIEFGSVLLDFKGNTLTARMINSDGVVRDTFQMVKEGKVVVKRIAKPWQAPVPAGPRTLPIVGPDPGQEKESAQAVEGRKYKFGRDSVEIIPHATPWQYLAGAQPAEGWRLNGFKAEGWKTGKAGFGYGDKDDATPLDEMRGKYRYVCIRREFELKPGQDPAKLALVASYDDGFIVYLNGQEVRRQNVETGALETVRGVAPHEAKAEFFLFPLKEARSLMKPGVNTLAIEGYNDDLGSSDFTLDPYLILTK